MLVKKQEQEAFRNALLQIPSNVLVGLALDASPATVSTWRRRSNTSQKAGHFQMTSKTKKRFYPQIAEICAKFNQAVNLPELNTMEKVNKYLEKVAQKTGTVTNLSTPPAIQSQSGKLNSKISDYFWTEDQKTTVSSLAKLTVSERNQKLKQLGPVYGRSFLAMQKKFSQLTETKTGQKRNSKKTNIAPITIGSVQMSNNISKSIKIHGKAIDLKDGDSVEIRGNKIFITSTREIDL